MKIDVQKFKDNKSKWNWNLIISFLSLLIAAGSFLNSCTAQKKNQEIVKENQEIAKENKDLNLRNEALNYTIEGKEIPLNSGLSVEKSDKSTKEIYDISIDEITYEISNHKGITIKRNRGSFYKIQYIRLNSSVFQTDYPNFDFTDSVNSKDVCTEMIWAPVYTSFDKEKIYDYVFLYIVSPNGETNLDTVCIDVFLDRTSNTLTYGDVHHYQKAEMLMFEEYLDDGDPLKDIAKIYKAIYDKIFY